MPAIWARSKNLSDGLRPVIISTSRNSTCPPSRAGMGRMFMKANTSESHAVRSQKVFQFHWASKMPPMVPNPPICWIPDLVNRNFREIT